MEEKKKRIIKINGREIDLSKLSKDELLELQEYARLTINNEKIELANKIKEISEDTRDL